MGIVRQSVIFAGLDGGTPLKRLSQVNAALKKLKLRATITRFPSGYYYFYGDDVPMRESTSIYSYSLTRGDYTVEEIVKVLTDAIATDERKGR